MAKTSDKHIRYINKIKNDPQKLKELREKAAERMKNAAGLKHI